MNPAATKELREQISIEGVYAAREIIAPHLNRTPLIRHPLLAEAVGCDIHLKHENHLPTGAFKIRGGLNLMTNLPEEDRARGVVTATRGNHGQSIALAATINNVRSVICVPHKNNPEKNAAMKAYGAELIEHGNDFDEAREHAESLVKQHGLRYVDSANDPHLIHGVATYSLEILEDLPDIDIIIVPVGGGSAISGAITVFRTLKPDVSIIGVQAENAPCIFESWRTGNFITTDSANTIADGLATRVPFHLTLDIIRDSVDDIVLVSEKEIREAMTLIARTTHNLAEGAGAAPVAAAQKLGDQCHDKKVVAILSGGNIDTSLIPDLFH